MPVTGSTAKGFFRYRASRGRPQRYIALPISRPITVTVAMQTHMLLRTRLILPAPRFWLAKVSAAWWMAFIEVYTKPSRLLAAEFAATTTSPKPLMED